MIRRDDVRGRKSNIPIDQVHFLNVRKSVQVDTEKERVTVSMPL